MHAPPAAPLTPWQEAEQARQVVNVLARIEQRFAEGRWDSGYRFSPRGGNCLIGAIDEATRWVLPGVTDRVTAELTAQLPVPLRVIAKVRPRLALAAYNDTVAGRDGAMRLVREARYALGGLPMIRFVGEDRPRPWSSGTRPATPTSRGSTDLDPSSATATRPVDESRPVGTSPVGTSPVGTDPTAWPATGPTSSWTARRPSPR
jgi:hypothetical protein